MINTFNLEEAQIVSIIEELDISSFKINFDCSSEANVFGNKYDYVFGSDTHIKTICGVIKTPQWENKYTIEVYNSGISYSFDTKVGGVIKRKTKSSPSIRFLRDDIYNNKQFCLDLEQAHKEHKQYRAKTIAKVVVENRKNYTEEDIKLIEVFELEQSYLQAKDKKSFLIDNGFTGLEWFDSEEKTSNMYGHKVKGKYRINFKTKTLTEFK